MATEMSMLQRKLVFSILVENYKETHLLQLTQVCSFLESLWTNLFEFINWHKNFQTVSESLWKQFMSCP
jgi:hypothetical protein